jgi:hypothetical protein
MVPGNIRCGILVSPHWPADGNAEDRCFDVVLIAFPIPEVPIGIQDLFKILETWAFGPARPTVFPPSWTISDAGWLECLPPRRALEV